jgi:hypothetical protein
MPAARSFDCSTRMGTSRTATFSYTASAAAVPAAWPMITDSMCVRKANLRGCVLGAGWPITGVRLPPG